jgi:hypothetical protein
MDIDGKKRAKTFDMRDRWMKQEMKEGLRYYYSSDAKWMFKLPPRRWEKKKEDMCACPGTGSSRFTQAHSLRILFLYFFPSVSREGLDFFSSSSCEKFRRRRRYNIRCIHFHTLLLPPPKKFISRSGRNKKKLVFSWLKERRKNWARSDSIPSHKYKLQQLFLAGDLKKNKKKHRHIDIIRHNSVPTGLNPSDTFQNIKKGIK